MDHGTPIYKALEAVVNDSPTPEEAQQQIADILIAALHSYAQVTGLSTPGLFYVGTDNRAYRLDGPEVEFSSEREAALATGIITHAMRVIAKYQGRRRGLGDSEDRARTYSSIRVDRPERLPVPEPDYPRLTSIPLGSPAERELLNLPPVLRYVTQQARVREGRVWNNRFWWVDMEADAWDSTDLYRGPLAGKCFVRLKGKIYHTNEFAEGEIQGGTFRGWASPTEEVSTKKYTVMHPGILSDS